MRAPTGQYSTRTPSLKACCLSELPQVPRSGRRSAGRAQGAGSSRRALTEPGTLVAAATSNLRRMQLLVLECAAKHLYVTPTLVSEWARREYGLELDRRYFHGPIRRLVRRGLLEPVPAGRVGTSTG
jgi:hypothetical protein